MLLIRICNQEKLTSNSPSQDNSLNHKIFESGKEGNVVKRKETNSPSGKRLRL